MLVTIAAVVLTLAPEPQAAPSFADLRKRYEAACTAHDRAACEQVWRDAKELVLPLIDADLEGSLKLVEKGEKLDSERVRSMRERALWGASIAAELLDRPLLYDYASAFVGWKDEVAQEFRAGQKAYHDAKELAKKGDHRAALDQAESCCAHASSLGDWWGLAMGHDARGAELQALARLDQALEAYATARALNHALLLASDELADVQHVAELCFALGRDRRGLAAAQQGAKLARELGDVETLATLLDREAQLDERLGDADGAQRARAQAAAAKAEAAEARAKPKR